MDGSHAPRNTQSSATLSALELRPDEIYRPSDPQALGPPEGPEAEPPPETWGQEEAIHALEFGLAMAQEGYNAFVLGPAGSGRLTTVRRILAAQAKGRPTPPDWCYVYDFDDPRTPMVLSLPPGRGPALRSDLSSLIQDLRQVLPESLESDDVSSRRNDLIAERVKEAEEALEGYRSDLGEDPHVALVGSPHGFTLVPARGGEPLGEKAYEALPESHRDEIDQHMRQARERLSSLERQIHQLNRQAQARVEEFHLEVVRSVVEPRIAALKEDHEDVPEVLDHLDRVQADILAHWQRFMVQAEDSILEDLPFGGDFFRRYRVNVLVTRVPDAGAPMVEERNPTLRNMFGQIERRVHLGAMVTDFTQIVPGATHRANGGYLVVDADELVTRPFSWSALKRSLLTRELKPGDTGMELGLTATESLEPMPIPLDVRVIMVGDPNVYYLLRAFDPDFQRLFKVKVDFAERLDRSPANERGLAAWLSQQVHINDTPSFSPEALASLVEESARAAGDQRKLSACLIPLRDRALEAAQLAHSGGKDRVERTDVESAVRAWERRENRPHRELLEHIERGILAFEPQGTEVGLIHGIALLFAAGPVFGRPIRVMASAFAGKEGVVNIERETEMSGPIHNKGFLVLSGYLGRKFARERPLILSASLSFDQLYEEVEGDSASAAELYALLSAIGQIPMKQGIGVTGAINQEGTLLPVGGVTHKVEGFFAACERKGLTGEQGVLLPRRNVENLVLRREVREAVEEGRFHVWAADRVSEGWAVLAGMPAGEPDEEGVFPEGSVYRAVQDRLDAWAEQALAQEGGPQEIWIAEPDGEESGAGPANAEQETGA
jgi:predicted ATP-dependent protease